MHRFLRPALFACAVCALKATPPDVPLSSAQAALARLPLRFEANQGQANPAVLYTAHASGYQLFLTRTGATIGLGGSRRVDMALLNSNRAAKLEGLDRLSTHTNYMVGRRENWRSDIPSFGRVAYREVYPGVDVIYYGNQNEVEFDFVLAPGTDPRGIRMKFRGARHVSISPEGDLVIEAGGSRMVQKRPVVFQDGRRVDGRYAMLRGGVVGVRVDQYDRTRALVIDPVLSYSTYMGGTGADMIRAAKLGPKGLLYMAGSTETQDLPATENAYTNISEGTTDIFIAIIDTTPPAPGNASFPITYFSYFGGTAIDIPKAIDVDARGILYLTGSTASTDFPTKNAAFQTSGAASTTDAFVLQLDTVNFYGTDSLLFSTYLGGTDGDDVGNGIVVGPDGMIYVIGNTKSTDFPITRDALADNQHRYGPQDIFISKINPGDGSLAYSTYLGGEGIDDGRAIALGTDGFVYFAASTLSQQFPMAGFSYNNGFVGAEAVVVGMLDLSKGSNALQYATYLGGNDVFAGVGGGLQEARAMTLDANNNIVVTGYTTAANFPVTDDALQFAINGNADAFVSIINPRIPLAGGLVYSTYLGGSGGDAGYDIKTDSAGFVYLTGYTLSGDFPAVGDVPQNTWGKGTNLFLTKFKPGIKGREGIMYSSFFGATGSYVPSSLNLKADGTVLLVGYATLGLPISGGATQAAFAGGSSDGFVLVVGQ